ncbi:DUF4913 domain-containing protein [Nocardia sp. 004]|uniref:DUF4913 domain-containing protein n=1 Tax=Nocardia sp. 004 TaxID=3385978 RepID=UPI0039A15068
MTDDQEQPKLVYANVGEFVEKHLSKVYQRQVTDHSDTVWCPEWWRHHEAYIRLDALWQAWEYYRNVVGTGMSVWFLDHADPHMAKLFDPNGPFKYCSVRNGHKGMLSRLPVEPLQPGLVDHLPTEESPR